MRPTVAARMRSAYYTGSALEAEAQLTTLGIELDKTHPSAAASVREGLAQTLTVLRLDLPPTLARTLCSTNAIESMIRNWREHAKNVKRWRDGQMALRWCAAGMLEASKQFRRVNGHLHLTAVRAALEREVAQPVGATCHDEIVNVARCSTGRHRSSTEPGTSSGERSCGRVVVGCCRRAWWWRTGTFRGRGGGEGGPITQGRDGPGPGRPGRGAPVLWSVRGDVANGSSVFSL